MAAPTHGRARHPSRTPVRSLSGHLRATVLAVVAVLALTACSGEDEAPTPAEAIKALPDRAAVEAAAGAATEGEVTDDLVPAPGFIARGGALAVNEQQCTRDYGYSQVVDVCLMGDPDATRTIALWGDTRAAMWMPALARIAEQTGYRLAVFTKMGCPPLLGVTPWLAPEKRPYAECVTVNEQVPQVLRDVVRPDVVVIAGAVRNAAVAVDGRPQPLGTGRPDNTWTPDGAAGRVWQEGLATALRSVGGDDGPEVFMLGEAPYPTQDAPTCLGEHADAVEECAVDRETAVYAEHDRAVEQTTQDAGATYVSPLPWLCGEEVCPAVIDDHVVYRDTFHLNREYVLHISRALGAALGLDDWKDPAD